MDSVARGQRDGVVWGFFLAASGVIYSITALESLLALAGLLWLGHLVFSPGRVARPQGRLLVLLTSLAAWSLLAAILSPQPAVSLDESLSMLLWVAAPLGTVLWTASRIQRVRELLLLQAGLLGAWAVLEYALWWDGNPLLRVRGPYSHHMTLAGVLLVTTLQGLPRPTLRHFVGRRRGPLAGRLAVGLGLAGMLATLTRSAMLGFAAGLAVLFLTSARARHRWRTRVVLTAAGLMLLSLAVTVPFMSRAPDHGPQTAAQASITDRLVLWRAGWQMIREHPFFGVGPHRIRRVAATYLPAGYRRPGPPAHLHSTAITLAAEKGLPALFLALLLYATVLFSRPGRGLPALAPAGRGSRAAVVAFLVMGLFENNFGDVEVLFVHLLTLSILAVTSCSGRGLAVGPPEESFSQVPEGRQFPGGQGQLPAGVDPA